MNKEPRNEREAHWVLSETPSKTHRAQRGTASTRRTHYRPAKASNGALLVLVPVTLFGLLGVLLALGV